MTQIVQGAHAHMLPKPYHHLSTTSTGLPNPSAKAFPSPTASVDMMQLKGLSTNSSPRNSGSNRPSLDVQQ